MTEAAAAVDATADEIHDVEPVPVEPTTALAIVEPRAGAIIAAEDPQEILTNAQQIAAPLKDLIESAGLAKSLDRRNPERKHVEVGGWQAAGTMLGALGGQPLHAETVWTRRVVGEDGQLQRTRYTATVRRYYPKNQGGGVKSETTYDVDGFDWEACVEIKTPAGVIVGRAEAMVSRTESTWAQRDDYALRSMAETRAESRAWRKACGWIVHLAGYNPTPAEEMGGGANVHDDAPAAIPLASDKARTNAQKSIALFLADYMSPQQASAEAWKVLELIEQRDDTRLTAHHAGALILAAKAVHSAKVNRAEPPQEEKPEPLRQGPISTHTSRMREAREAEEHAEHERASAAQKEQATEDPPPPDWVPPRDADGRPAAGTIALDDPKAAEYCICPNGLDTASADTNSDCPIAGHGIPF